MVSMDKNVLIIGYGNQLRGDEGISDIARKLVSQAARDIVELVEKL